MHSIMARPLSGDLGHAIANNKQDSVGLLLESPPHKVVKSSTLSSNNNKVLSPQRVLDNSGPSDGGAGHYVPPSQI